MTNPLGHCVHICSESFAKTAAFKFYKCCSVERLCNVLRNYNHTQLNVKLKVSCTSLFDKEINESVFLNVSKLATLHVGKFLIVFHWMYKNLLRVRAFFTHFKSVSYLSINIGLCCSIICNHNFGKRYCTWNGTMSVLKLPSCAWLLSLVPLLNHFATQTWFLFDEVTRNILWS